MEQNFGSLFVRINKSVRNAHCVKSVQVLSVFWSVFSRIRTEYGDLLRIQFEYGKIRTRKNSVFGHFSRSGSVNRITFVPKLLDKNLS